MRDYIDVSVTIWDGQHVVGEFFEEGFANRQSALDFAERVSRAVATAGNIDVTMYTPYHLMTDEQREEAHQLSEHPIDCAEYFHDGKIFASEVIE